MSQYEDMKDSLYVCENEYRGAKLVNRIHPVPERNSDPCVTSGVGMWHEKIYHFLPDKPPSSGGDELQSEFFVPAVHLPEVINRIYTLQPLFEDVI